MLGVQIQYRLSILRPVERIQSQLLVLAPQAHTLFRRKKCDR